MAEKEVGLAMADFYGMAVIKRVAAYGKAVKKRMAPWGFLFTLVVLLLLLSWVGTRDLLEELQNHGSLGPSDAPVVVTTIASLATAVGALVGGTLAGLSKFVKARGEADAERTRANADMIRAEAEMLRARKGLPPLETPPDGDTPQLQSEASSRETL